MSSINIHEYIKDDTGSTSIRVNYNVAVPVLVAEEDAVDLEIAEYSSLTAFNNAFPNPLAIAWNNGHDEFAYDIDPTTKGAIKYETDLSYLFAVDMLQRGANVVAIPVMVSDADFVKYTNTDSEGGKTVTTTYKVLDYYKASDLVNGAYALVGDDKKLAAASEFLKDRLSLPLRFLTTGGYPNMFNSNKDTRFGVSGIAGMVGVANARQDCAVLGELPEDFMLGATTVEIAEYVSSLDAVESSKRFIGFAPHYTATLAATKAAASKYIINATATTAAIMPACHAYLSKFMDNVIGNGMGSWYAIAGVNRGAIATSSKGLTYNLTQAEARYLRGEGTYSGNYAPVTFNPIVKTRNYGYVIDGNNTGNCSGKQAGQKDFSNFANVRQLLCEINQYCYDTALTVLYEPNNDFAWQDFKAGVNALLESMMDNRGIQYYYWKRETNVGLGMLKATLTVRPIEALEDIDITINVTDEDQTSVTSA